MPATAYDLEDMDPFFRDLGDLQAKFMSLSTTSARSCSCIRAGRSCKTWNRSPSAKLRGERVHELRHPRPANRQVQRCRSAQERGARHPSRRHRRPRRSRTRAPLPEVRGSAIAAAEVFEAGQGNGNGSRRDARSGDAPQMEHLHVQGVPPGLGGPSGPLTYQRDLLLCRPLVQHRDHVVGLGREVGVAHRHGDRAVTHPLPANRETQTSTSKRGARPPGGSTAGALSVASRERA